MSTSSGWDAVPSHLFKKPILYTNYVPIALMSTFSDKYILTTKKIFDTSENKILTFKEIYDKNISFLTTDDDYIKNNLVLIENTPEEIKEAAIEMHLLINNKLIFEINDLDNQYKFWNAYPKHIKESYYKKRYLHGELKAIFSPFFLRNNINLLE